MVLPSGHGEPTRAPVEVGSVLIPTSYGDFGARVFEAATLLLGAVRPCEERPYVLVKYAQTLDGRIATRTGDSKWISGEAERRISHALRAACDAVLVGSGTVRRDDPELTVRLVPGVNPIRVVLDSTLRMVPTAKVVGDIATTVVFTTPAADTAREEQLRAAGVTVHQVTAGPQGVDLTAVLAHLRGSGVESLMVEGGRRVITSLFAARQVDRLVVSISPTVIGTGVEAVGDLGIGLVAEGVRLTNRAVCLADDDVLLGWDVGPRTGGPSLTKPKDSGVSPVAPAQEPGSARGRDR